MRRRFLIPEVVQTSAMDCGPAALTALAAGHGLEVSYAELRDRCQTDVDGTSIDVLEILARELGFDATQVVIPDDHLLLGDRPLPAIAIVVLPDGATHFVVLWRQVAGWIQVMDPAVGRRWMPVARVRDDLYRHRMPVPQTAWREYAGSEDFLGPLRARLDALRVSAGAVTRLASAATDDRGWEALGRLDAATRLTSALVDAGSLSRGESATGFLCDAMTDGRPVPDQFWSVGSTDPSPDGTDQVWIRGAVLVRIREPEATHESAGPRTPSPTSGSAHPEARASLSSVHRIWRVLSPGRLTVVSLMMGLALTGIARVAEAAVAQLLLDTGTGGQVATGATLGLIAAFLLTFLGIEWGVQHGLLAVGRAMELDMRRRILQRIPFLGDAYFRSRPASDLAERAHAVHHVRALPEVAGHLLRLAVQLLATLVALTWVDPGSLRWGLLLVAVAVGVPLVAQGPLVERDLRWRTHGGVLARTYLDALLGLVPLRAHVADRAVRNEHDRLLTEWTRTGRSVQRLAALSDGFQALLTLLLVGALVVSSVNRGVRADVGLLVLFWAMTLPTLGLELAAVLRRWPTLRNSVLRLVEPLTAELVDVEVQPGGEATGVDQPVSLELRNVVVQVGGHRILEGISLRIGSGEHVALVGPSGAGKSTLVALPLGFHRPVEGSLLVDGRDCDAEEAASLRPRTVWVDPAVALWNRSLADNLRYDHDVDPARSGVVETAGLTDVAASLPAGLDEVIGESGGLLSGGQGQRVRLGRALGVPRPRLVVLDEPFRGLDRELRHDLLGRAREQWAGVTLLCVTHDVSETVQFDRVLVVADGLIVEDGDPARLAADPTSRYRAMLDAESSLRTSGWGDIAWRRWDLTGGRLHETCEPSPKGAAP